MEEQLSGSCTVEIAAFNQFAECMTDDAKQTSYDHIIFDTAPTGHTLRLLQLPAAWSNFISENTHGASCLGQLSGLESKKQIYKAAVNALSDASQTLVILVARPELSPLKEAERASSELATLNINNQLLLINGVLDSHNDQLSEAIYKKQQSALANIPHYLTKFPCYTIPYRPYNITGLKNVRGLLTAVDLTDEITPEVKLPSLQHLNRLIDDLAASNKRVIFTMGKGGVGKTTIAAAIATVKKFI
jgi:arsenite-transporting ATPase